MEERKTVFDYMGQIFITFGFSIVVLNIFCILVGEGAQEVSTIFSMGKQGLAVTTMMQFFGVSVCITGLRAFFFTDKIIKRMSIAMRSVCMLTSIVVLVVICAVMFGWFPVTMWQSWAGFLITFALCFVGSLILMTLKERTEDRKMEEALQRLKEQEGKGERT
ncbi:MAG: hypothetical protein K2J99_08345 [Lachnospiraceae bacterium]|nr:hypothetical protein [Lachnospiraceae bacterium]